MAKTRGNVLFVVLAYGLFWALLVATLLLFSGDPELFSTAVDYVSTIGPWAPTAALLILFRRLYPGWTIRGFYKDAFKARLKPGVLLMATLAYVAIAAFVVGLESVSTGVAVSGLLSFSVAGLLTTIFSGAMGEESGWRGHLQRQVEKRHSVIKSSLIVGVIWAFWHTITWVPMIQAGYAYFIPLHILSLMSCAMIIGISFSRCRNLFVPMWIHFMSNIVLNGAQSVLNDATNPSLAIYIGLEALVAVCYVIWFVRVSKKEAAAAGDAGAVPA